MKKNIKILSLAIILAFGTTACEKALDINDNPNSPTSSTPELVLPQAMVGTAALVPQFNTYGSRLVGYYATSGGVSGWGDMITYDFSTANFTGLWSNSYNILNDLQYVVVNTKDNEDYQAFYHAAEILKAFNFANLVDTYNDIPYTEALQGTAFLTPKYDKGDAIYVDLAKKLDQAIAFFKAQTTLPTNFAPSDVIFNGNSQSWAKFANTLKLKLVIRAGAKANFENRNIDAIGIITDDVIVNPGYSKTDGKQNPMWNTWAYNASGAAVGTWGTQFIPTHYIMAFYDGSKLTDPNRANLVFSNGISTNKNQLGNTTNAPTGVSPSAWVQRPATGSISATNYKGTGVIKGPQAGQPLMLLAEGNFLAAEGVISGLLNGSSEAFFNSGIKASYLYLNKNESDALESGVNADAYLTKYLADNSLNYLANYSLATNDELRKEAIVTQKYIALNFLFGHEAWNEYRRTHYPKIVGANNAANAKTTFVSTESASTAPDKLPTRLLYPNTEFSYNSGNVPAQINKYSTKIFWAK